VTGDNYWLIVAPIVFFVTLIGWVVLLLVGGTRDRQYRHKDIGKRGAVAGAIVEGSPAQVNSGRVIELPDVTEDEPEPEPPQQRPGGWIRRARRAVRTAVRGRHG